MKRQYRYIFSYSAQDCRCETVSKKKVQALEGEEVTVLNNLVRQDRETQLIGYEAYDREVESQGFAKSAESEVCRS